MCSQNITFLKVEILIVVFFFVYSCKPAYFLFDHDPPKLIPKVFAQNVISKNNEHIGYCSFNKSGSELYYALTDSNWAMSRILKVSTSDLSKIDTLFLKDKIYEGEPFISHDGKIIYFTVISITGENSWQSDIYKVFKIQNGLSKPVLLNSIINSSASEWHISGTHNNIFYFASEREKGTSALFGDIYRIELKNDSFQNLTKLPYPINTDFNDSDPLIAPNEKFLIFHSNHPGGFGEHDLYISFRKKGKWSNPINLGKEINTEQWEMAPSLTPDGEYLLFTRRKAIVTSEPSQIYWVSMKLISRLKYKNRIE